MTSTNSSWGAAITAHLQTAKAEKVGHTNGAYAEFTRPGFAYARFPLRASPKQIREANHLMLQQGYCCHGLHLGGLEARVMTLVM